MSDFSLIVDDGPWLLMTGKSATFPRTSDRSLREKLLVVDGDTAAHLSNRGIVCASPDVEAMAALDKVDALLRNAPNLMCLVNACVQEVVVLRTPADEYDVSHSEPQWRDRIYTSIPNRSLVQDLRVSEAVVHEAMHLNLTLFEQGADVFRHPSKLLYSPWREQDRPASGVFHGLYVFRCVEQFFSRFVLPNEVEPIRIDFLNRRLAQINSDISQVDLEGLSHCMGVDGIALLNRLVARQ